MYTILLVSVIRKKVSLEEELNVALMWVDMSVTGRHVTAALTKQTWQIIHCQALVCSFVATASSCCEGQCRWVTCGSLDNQRGYCARLAANTSWRDQSDSAHRDGPEDRARRTWSSFQHHLNTHTENTSVGFKSPRWSWKDNPQFFLHEGNSDTPQKDFKVFSQLRCLVGLNQTHFPPWCGSFVQVWTQ